jgi:hypothetical protein
MYVEPRIPTQDACHPGVTEELSCFVRPRKARSGRVQPAFPGFMDPSQRIDKPTSALQHRSPPPRFSSKIPKTYLDNDSFHNMMP